MKNKFANRLLVLSLIKLLLTTVLFVVPIHAEPLPTIGYEYKGSICIDDYIDTSDTFILKKTFVVSFYTNDWSENSGIEGLDGVNAFGDPLQNGMIACNKLPLMSEIYFDGNKHTILDRGHYNNFGSISTNYAADNIRVDRYMPKLEGESRREYLRRINMMGHVEYEGYIVIDRELAEELKGEPIITEQDYELWLKTEEGKIDPPEIDRVNLNYKRFLETGSYIE